MRFNIVSMWIQLHGMPCRGMNRECGKRIENSIGIAEKVEVNDGVSIIQYLVKITIE